MSLTLIGEGSRLPLLVDGKEQVITITGKSNYSIGGFFNIPVYTTYPYPMKRAEQLVHSFFLQYIGFCWMQAERKTTHEANPPTRLLLSSRIVRRGIPFTFLNPYPDVRDGLRFYIQNRIEQQKQNGNCVTDMIIKSVEPQKSNMILKVFLQYVSGGCPLSGLTHIHGLKEIREFPRSCLILMARCWRSEQQQNANSPLVAMGKTVAAAFVPFSSTPTTGRKARTDPHSNISSEWVVIDTAARPRAIAHVPPMPPREVRAHLHSDIRSDWVVISTAAQSTAPLPIVTIPAASFPNRIASSPSATAMAAAIAASPAPVADQHYPLSKKIPICITSDMKTKTIKIDVVDRMWINAREDCFVTRPYFAMDAQHISKFLVENAGISCWTKKDPCISGDFLVIVLNGKMLRTVIEHGIQGNKIKITALEKIPNEGYSGPGLIM